MFPSPEKPLFKDVDIKLTGNELRASFIPLYTNITEYVKKMYEWVVETQDDILLKELEKLYPKAIDILNEKTRIIISKRSKGE